MKYKRGLVWFRQDLRTIDNTALLAASVQCKEIVPVFIATTQISAPTPTHDTRCAFLYETLTELDKQLQAL